MQLNKQLILFQYILKQLGYESFATLREEFNTNETGANSIGRSYFANVLTNRSQKLIDNTTLYAYDEAIQGYEKRLRDNRAEPFFTFKYYQWFSLLFTEYYLDQFVNHKTLFVDSLNAFKHTHKDFNKIDDYTESDLKKIAFWMATGSGKTLLMHCNYWQIRKYIKTWENILLITPNEGLSRQHYESLIESGIPAKLYSGNEESIKTKEGEVLIIEITKLVRDKEGQGVSVDVDYFSESQNLVLIDEGHKGQKSEERAWKGLREHIARGNGSFTFEYSATFGQIIDGKANDLLQEYGKSIIFDYSYRYFYSDGYGKDFSVFNLNEKNTYSDEQKRFLLTASLLGFYEQLELFSLYKAELKTYNIEKPLWVFVGSRVIGSSSSSLTNADKENISDVSLIVKYFEFALSHPKQLQKYIDQILNGQSDLKTDKGDDVFKNRFEYLKQHKPNVETILFKVFHSIGSLEAYQIKQADGEIGLKTKSGEHYFAVINIGDVPKYAKELDKYTEGVLTVQDDNFTKSLFQAISDTSSPINILIGSKKFIEGWNSWRVSSMGLMNMGQKEGAQIIQLFGRGVRLKGKNFSLKREEATASYHIKALQTISIVGLNASYMNSFLKGIESEIPHYDEYPLEIKFNRETEWMGKIMTFKTEQGRHFKEQDIVQLTYQPNVAKRVSVDLRHKISVATGGFNSQIAEDASEYFANFLKPHIGFLDFNNLALEANRYKLLKGYANLIIHKSALEELIKGDRYYLYCNSNQFGLPEAINGKMQNIAHFIIKDYINKFYADKEKAYLSKYLTYEMLDKEIHQDMFPESQRMLVKVPEQYKDDFKDFENIIKDLYQDDHKLIPTLHFGNHLYSPLAIWGKGEKYEDIKTIPVRLNEDETRFLKHLKGYLGDSASKMKDKEIFILRNLSIKGLGFFMESSSFYPDFIVWVIEEKKQYIYFLDPKGIRESRNFNNDKIIFCRDQVGDLEQKINEDLQTDGLDLSVKISAYILSKTPFKEISAVWGAGRGTTKIEFKENKVLFIEDNISYLEEIFKDF